MKLAIVAALALTVSTPALAAGSLPATVAPVLYDITIKPDARAMTFTGSETVQIDVKAATDRITLNAADLAIASATFDGKPVRVTLDTAKQTLSLILPTSASVGRHSVGFSWSGKINQSAAGLFAIDYTNQDGSKARMLATQFEAPDARRFAPMWDEPAFKAKFRLKATAPGGQLAFSNMPATSVTRQADGTQLYSFAETPVMSSYLLYLGMGDLQRKTVQAGNVEIGVITRRGVVDQGDYALAEAKRLLPYYNSYFGQPYPLPKLDMIAGPGSSQFFGAMENWGAIFYFEPELLFDPQRATESGRQRIFTVVAHEMAHQWFGDLVTMKWWDDLWLNEGFASWMENKSAADLNPSWKADADAVAGDREKAMGIDATSATHPIIRKVETVDEIGDAFDNITYSKGQAVIGMLESTLGADTFRDGIRRYMARYKFGNTVTEQLWAELSAAAGQPVADIAHGFTLQGGVPLVTLTQSRCVDGRTVATLAQGRFGLDAASRTPQTWKVPLVVATAGGGETRAVVTGPATQVSVLGCGTLLLNKGKGSYTRVMYDQAAHDAIVRDYTRLPLQDRLGTLADDYALAAGGYQDLSRFFAVMGKVGLDADPLEWGLVSNKLGSLSNAVAGTSAAAKLRARTIAILGPVLQRIGYVAMPGESPLVSNLRETLVDRLGESGDAQVLRQARRYVSDLETNPAAIPPAIRTPILSTFAANATAADWDLLLRLTKAETNPVAKNRFVNLLGEARDDALATRALALLKTDTFTAPQRAALLKTIAGSHPDMAFDWAVANRALVDSFIEESSRAGFIVSLGGGSLDPKMPAKIAAFAQTLPATSRGPADRVVSGIAVGNAARARLRPAVETWLANGG